MSESERRESTETENFVERGRAGQPTQPTSPREAGIEWASVQDLGGWRYTGWRYRGHPRPRPPKPESK